MEFHVALMNLDRLTIVAATSATLTTSPKVTECWPGKREARCIFSSTWPKYNVPASAAVTQSNRHNGAVNSLARLTSICARSTMVLLADLALGRGHATPSRVNAFDAHAVDGHAGLDDVGALLAFDPRLSGVDRVEVIGGQHASIADIKVVPNERPARHAMLRGLGGVRLCGRGRCRRSNWWAHRGRCVGRRQFSLQEGDLAA